MSGQVTKSYLPFIREELLTYLQAEKHRTALEYFQKASNTKTIASELAEEITLSSKVFMLTEQMINDVCNELTKRG